MSDNQRPLWPRVLWSEAIWESDLKPTQRLLALAYADHARNEATAWVAYPRLMARTGLSRDTVARQLGALVEAGWLTLERSARQHRAAVYRLSYPSAQQSDHRTAERPNLEPQQSDHRTPEGESADSSSQILLHQQSDSAAQQSDIAVPAVRPSDSINLPTPLPTPGLTPPGPLERREVPKPENSMMAEALTQAWWERQSPRPTGPYSKALASVRAVLKAGHQATAVATAMEGLEPPLSAGRIEYAIGRGRARSGRWSDAAKADLAAHADHWAQPDAKF